MKKKKAPERPTQCRVLIQGVRDTQDLLNGKWKTPIIGALYYRGKMRFMELRRELDGIAPKMLSQELKDLEMNHLVTRTVHNTMPITVEYELTEQGKSLNSIIDAMGRWGIKYREQMLRA
ncbi:helix-turn-helix transcriptional regulator [Fulvivirga sp. 29W222]|uniref:Helix-turn-helix transcriptional regulator n=1 Tax=Fulvivirga marina TaxID=2494733 RepID=A0A937FY67_9BACT|nr:helix-turn-helix domain-containing protein [Fulvivirga marina]MBL6446693.1 helix-turn-helix transcriptional regulator [Fulvivirga marina]